MARDLSEDVYRLLADEYQAGLSLAQIEAKHGRSRTAVKTACAMFGVPMRKQGVRKGVPPERLKRIREALESGMSRRAVKAEFRTSHDIIRRAMSESEVDAERARNRRLERKTKRVRVNKALSEEVDAAIERDRRRMEEMDRLRMLRAAA